MNMLGSSGGKDTDYLDISWKVFIFSLDKKILTSSQRKPWLEFHNLRCFMYLNRTVGLLRVRVHFFPWKLCGGHVLCSQFHLGTTTSSFVYRLILWCLSLQPLSHKEREKVWRHTHFPNSRYVTHVQLRWIRVYKVSCTFSCLSHISSCGKCLLVAEWSNRYKKNSWFQAKSD